jgi:hypothetical protein
MMYRFESGSVSILWTQLQIIIVQAFRSSVFTLGIRCHSIPSSVVWCLKQCGVVSQAVWCGVVWCGVVWCGVVSSFILRTYDVPASSSRPSISYPPVLIMQNTTERNRLRSRERNVRYSLALVCPLIPPPPTVGPLSVLLPFPASSSPISAAACLPRRVSFQVSVSVEKIFASTVCPCVLCTPFTSSIRPFSCVRLSICVDLSR